MQSIYPKYSFYKMCFMCSQFYFYFIYSYTVATGLVDILAKRCLTVRESVENQQSVVLSLLAILGFLTKLAELCPKGTSDSTRFLSMVKSTELFGSISLLYSTVVPIGEYKLIFQFIILDIH